MGWCLSVSLPGIELVWGNVMSDQTACMKCQNCSITVFRLFLVVLLAPGVWLQFVPATALELKEVGHPMICTVDPWNESTVDPSNILKSCLGWRRDHLLFPGESSCFETARDPGAYLDNSLFPPCPPDRVEVECMGSLARLKLNTSYFQKKYISFAALDTFGRSWLIDETQATKCGYTIFQDVWGNIEIRASLIGCYAKMVDDQHFNLNMQIQVATDAEMRDAVVLNVPVMCPYGPWQPREVVCEANYMEVSVRRNVPHISNDILQDQPEDWASAFPEAKAGAPSIWQIVFHMDTRKKAMPVEEAHAVGYGVNTTDTRIVLRASYNATEAQKLLIDGVLFSAVRSSTYYKQRWMLLMVDTAVACPIDGVTYTNNIITWTIPKGISPLLAEAGTIKELHVELGINLYKLSAQDISRQGYSLASDKEAIVVKIPLGAPGGSYKSFVVSGKLAIAYQINPFVEHLWEDDKRSVTKHTILKEINTPLQLVPVMITYYTNLPLRLFNATIGTFLPDIELVTVTLDELGPLPLPEAAKHGCTVFGTRYPNGSRGYVLQIPFDNPRIKKEYVPDNIRNYTITPILGFIVIPQGDTFYVPVPLSALVEDAVLPQAEGFCDDQALYLVVKHGNVDQDWLPSVGEVLLTQEMAQSLGYMLQDNRTHLALWVPRHAAHVFFEEIQSFGIVATFKLLLKDRLSEVEMIDFAISCTFSSKDLIGKISP
ncbi:Fibrillarin-like rRNA/tRNA 2'-O-methyltransferase [Varanus komodoensis]|nr:Fibrillarin-like rRNA/tRNA 2'-O-methyltransferase [Varanus komodoensis]